MKIGIDIGGSHIGVGLVEGQELIKTSDRFYTADDRSNMEEAVINIIEELVNNLLSDTNISLESIERIGVACPGTVTDGRIMSYNLGLFDYNLRERLEERFHKPVSVRNDGKCAGLVEKEYGALKDYDDCLFINIGTGIGGAAFLGGKLLETKKYSAFEFGHMTLVKDGIQCTCGKKGCFERYCSIKSLKNRIVKRLNLPNSDFSGQYMRETLLVEHAEEVKPDIDDFVDYLRMGLCNLIDIFEPEAICFGGSFSYYEEFPIFEQMRREVYREDVTFNHSKPKLVTAEFKNDAGIIGATL